MKSRQNLASERQHRLRQDDQRLAVDFIAPAATLYHVAQREQKTAATGISESSLHGAVVRLAPLFDHLAKAVQVDIWGSCGPTDNISP